MDRGGEASVTSGIGTPRRRAHLLALEPRMMFDAAAGAVVQNARAVRGRCGACRCAGRSRCRCRARRARYGLSRHPRRDTRRPLRRRPIDRDDGDGDGTGRPARRHLHRHVGGGLSTAGVRMGRQGRDRPDRQHEGRHRPDARRAGGRQQHRRDPHRQPMAPRACCTSARPASTRRRSRAIWPRRSARSAVR